MFTSLQKEKLFLPTAAFAPILVVTMLANLVLMTWHVLSNWGSDNEASMYYYSECTRLDREIGFNSNHLFIYASVAGIVLFDVVYFGLCFLLHPVIAHPGHILHLHIDPVSVNYISHIF